MKRGFLNKSKKPLYPDPGTKSSITTSGVAAPSTDQEIFKIPYGKVENIAPLPKNYKSSECIYEEADSSKTNHTKGTILFTIIPARTVDGPPDPDGHSMWVVHRPTRNKVLNAPGYPSAVPKPNGGPCYIIRSTPNMGLGLFATRKIKVKELIFAERPLLVMPANVGIFAPPGVMQKNMDNTTLWNVVCAEAEKHIGTVVSRMSPEDQEAYKALANNHTEDGSGPLLGIARTNAYGISKIFDGPKEIGTNRYGGTCKIGSRINHSCMPNTTHDFSLASFSFQFTATRDIEAGEQLFFSYADINISAAARAAQLAPYGINKCACSACTNATPETDRLHQEFEQIIEEYQTMASRLIDSPGPIDESVLRPILEFQEALIKEGLHAAKSYPTLLDVLSNLNSKLGRHDKATMYMNEMLSYIQ